MGPRAESSFTVKAWFYIRVEQRDTWWAASWTLTMFCSPLLRKLNFCDNRHDMPNHIHVSLYHVSLVTCGFTLSLVTLLIWKYKSGFVFFSLDAVHAVQWHVPVSSISWEHVTSTTDGPTNSVKRVYTVYRGLLEGLRAEGPSSWVRVLCARASILWLRWYKMVQN